MNLHAYSIFIYVFCVVSIEFIEKNDDHRVIRKKWEVYIHNIYASNSCLHFIFPFHRPKPVHDKNGIEICVGGKSHYICIYTYNRLKSIIEMVLLLMNALFNYSMTIFQFLLSGFDRNVIQWWLVSRRSLSPWMFWKFKMIEYCEAVNWKLMKNTWSNRNNPLQ